MDTLRIGTWNVERAKGETENAKRSALLREKRADIWILTETRDELSLGPEYQSRSSDPHDGAASSERWVTIWSRLPRVDPVRVNDTIRTVAAIYDTPLGRLLVYGTVLPWHSDRDTGDKNWSKHHRVIPEQAKEWAELHRRYHSAALCVAGDLNTNIPLSPRPDRYGTRQGVQLLEDGLTQAELACVTRTDRVPPDVLAKFDKPHIDHVLLPAAWAPRTRVVEAWPGTIDGAKLSDHSGLVVEVASLGAGSAP